MKKLVILQSLIFLLAPTLVCAKTYLVRLESQHLNSVENQYSGQLKKFMTTKSDYFKTMYTLETEATLSVLKKDTRLLSVEESIDVVSPQSIIAASQMSSLSNDPLLSYQWGLDFTNQKVLNQISDLEDKEIEGSAASDINIFDINQVEKRMKRDSIVAVIDSGVDYKHSDLADNIYRNEKECDANGNIIYFGAEDSDDENDFVGDCMGWDFTGKKEGGSNNPTDLVGHGTHVAGIIAAVRDNGLGISGLSNKIKILPLKVLSNNKSDTKGTSDRLAKAIIYATQMKVDVINLSLGWPVSFDKEHLQMAVKEALAAGVTIVAAAGNNDHSEPVLPCAYPGVICVGSSDPDRKISDFSNYGGHVDLLAPGNNIISTYPLGITPLYFDANGFEIKSGTSQSAPYVSGVVAILKSIYPAISEDEVKARLFNTTQSLVQGDRKYTNGGIVQASLAFENKLTSLVRPDFKKLSRVKMNVSDGSFEFTLQMKNYGTKVAGAQLSLSASDDIEFSQTDYKLSNITSYGTESITVRGHVKNKNSNVFQSMKVVVKGNNETKTYSNEIRFFVDFEEIPQKIEKDIIGATPEQITSLASLTYNHLEGLNEAYYTIKVSDAGLFVTIFDADEKNIKKVNSVLIEKGTQLISIHRLDANFDGEMDYLLRSIVSEGEGEASVVYSFFNKKLKPLYLKKATRENPKPIYLNEWKLKLESVILKDIDDAAFMPYESKDFGKVLVPTFTDYKDLQRPEADRVENPFARLRRKHFSSRIYYFEPMVNEDNTVTFITRTLNTIGFDEQLEAQMKFRPFDQVYVVRTYKQSFEDIKLGRMKILLSHESVGRSAVNYVLNIEGLENKKWSLEKVKGESFDLSSYYIERAIDLSAGEQVDHSNNLIMVASEKVTSLMWEQIDISPSRQTRIQTIRQESVTDSLEIPIKTYFKGDKSFRFFQTPSKIFLDYNDGAESNIFSMPVHVSTFLPGHLFQEQHYPIVIKNEGENYPALYVDSTQISSQNLYTITYKDGELFAPISLNVRVPENCRAKNPKVINNGFHYSLLCLEEGGRGKIVYLPVEI